jgi:RND family efflux transporter MFP subunit
MAPRLGPLCVALAVAISGCAGNSNSDTPAAGGPAAFPPMDVMSITIAPKAVAQTSEYVATIRSLRSTTIQPQVEGIVRQIFVRAGDQVRAGQPLVQIDPDKQQATVSTTESTRVARDADLAYARQQLARMQKLFEAGAVSRAELEQAETAAKTAQAQLDTVAAQIRESQVELQYYRVTAPSAGIVGEIAIRAGDRVTQATEITTIDQAQGLEAYVNVPLERANQLRPGLTIELLDAEGQIISSDPVTFIAPRADDATQSVLVKATLRRPSTSLRVMQYVRARVVWSNEPRLTVPIVALNRVNGQYFAFVVESGAQGDVARQRPVMIGQVIGEEYVVTGGLTAGDRVIVSNLQKLGDGAPVKAS